MCVCVCVGRTGGGGKIACALSVTKVAVTRGFATPGCHNVRSASLLDSRRAHRIDMPHGACHPPLALDQILCRPFKKQTL